MSPDEVRRLVDRYKSQRDSDDADLKREIGLLYSLLDAVRSLNSCSTSDELFHAVVRGAIKVCEAERGFILVVSESGERRTIALTADGGQWDAEADGYSSTVLSQVMDSGRRLVLDADDPSLAKRESAYELALRTVACYPLVIEDSVRGALYVHSRTGRSFGPVELRTLGALTELAIATITRSIADSRNERAAREIERLNAELSKRLREREDELDRTREALARQSSMFRVDDAYGGMIGLSPAMDRVIRLLTSLEGTELPVLVYGESGTGKELAARAVHSYSKRAAGPFLAVNCGAMPDSLLAAELFGYRKGAFTGAAQDRRGLFELASGGTLFLDEVVSMSPDMQKSLLRVLERGEVLPLGSEKARLVDVRVITAANRDVREMAKEGTFREDLYYRLAVVTVVLPPLRDRREDIPHLIQHFLKKYPNPNGVRLLPSAADRLQSFSWPGNIRQLENEIRRALALGKGDLDASFFSHLEQDGIVREATAPPALRLEELEKWAIERALQLSDGQKVKAASILGIPRRTLYEKLKKYGI